LYHPKEEKLWKHLMKTFSFNRSSREVLVEHIITVKSCSFTETKNGTYPKGELRKKKCSSMAHVREVMEETGAKDLIVKKESYPYLSPFFEKRSLLQVKENLLVFDDHFLRGSFLAPQLEEGIAKAELGKPKRRVPSFNGKCLQKHQTATKRNGALI
jgi:hypothetical protein